MRPLIRTSAVLAIGNEVLCGDVVNTNAAYIAGRLSRLGIECVAHSVIPDDMEMIVSETERLGKTADLIVTIGGLGPTQDDITKNAVARALGRELKYDPSTHEAVECFFSARGLEASANNERQCWQIEGSVLIPNDNGTAPGSLTETDDVTVAMFPGPPDELIPMFEDHFEPMIASRTERTTAEKVFIVYGLPESSLEEAIRENVTLSDNETLNTYIDDGAVRLVLTVTGKSPAVCERQCAATSQALRRLFGEHLAEGREDELLEHIGKLLKDRNITLATAESLTGGLLAGEITKISGISSVFRGGAVTYVNEIKHMLLDVPDDILETYGAVSAQCAEKMARGAAKRFGTKAALSTTGVAGPSMSEGKKVGTVFIGIYFEGKTEVLANNYIGSREKIRRKTVMDALNLLRRYLENS